jgi:hypothetical protein
MQSELDASASQGEMLELVAALRKFDDLPNRRAQFQALCDMPEFREFKITDALFREAREVPRDAGAQTAAIIVMKFATRMRAHLLARCTHVLAAPRVSS